MFLLMCCSSQLPGYKPWLVTRVNQVIVFSVIRNFNLLCQQNFNFHWIDRIEIGMIRILQWLVTQKFNTRSRPFNQSIFRNLSVIARKLLKNATVSVFTYDRYCPLNQSNTNACWIV